VLNIVIITASCTLLSGCSLFRGTERQPLPTFTPTSAILGISAGNAAVTETQINLNNQTAENDLIVITKAPAPTLTPMPTATPFPTATFIPTITSPPPTDIPTITNTPFPVLAPTPTLTLIPTASPIPEYLFDLEDYAKFPTDSLAPNVVRIYLYVYSQDEFALAGYSLLVRHNGILLAAEGESTGGLPTQTREKPGPYSRFTNYNVVFVEPQAGEWTVELLDSIGIAVGPPSLFTLTADEDTREMYVRYVLKENPQE